MPLLPNLHRIATADQQIRREALIEILEEMDAPYTVFEDRVRNRRPQNVVVPFHEGNPRSVIGAHYDSVSGSTGANDNAAGVCVLLEALKHMLKTPPSVPVDVVFFDQEERGFRGSQGYIERVSSENIRAFLNLDVCGVGDTITLAPREHVTYSPLKNTLEQVEQSGRHQVRTIHELPINDAWSFEQADIPNVTACILPYDEVDKMVSYVRAMNKFEFPDAYPTVMDTMHHGELDDIEIVEESAMQKVLAWVLDVVRAL